MAASHTNKQEVQPRRDGKKQTNIYHAYLKRSWGQSPDRNALHTRSSLKSSMTPSSLSRLRFTPMSSSVRGAKYIKQQDFNVNVNMNTNKNIKTTRHRHKNIASRTVLNDFMISTGSTGVDFDSRQIGVQGTHQGPRNKPTGQLEATRGHDLSIPAQRMLTFTITQRMNWEY